MLNPGIAAHEPRRSVDAGVGIARRPGPAAFPRDEDVTATSSLLSAAAHAAACETWREPFSGVCFAVCANCAIFAGNYAHLIIPQSMTITQSDGIQL